MGVYAPALQWIPEDDILLKNAIEAGASFESLAKGAVNFSRRFTVKEVRERWQLILYDPLVSTEASDLMLELAPAKLSQNGNAKENILPEKRKSVRHCYYAMRKRIMKEPFMNSMDLSFHANTNCNGTLGDPISNHIGFDQTNLELMHQSFPQNVTCRPGAYSIENIFSGEQNGVQESPVCHIYEASELDHDNDDTRNLCTEYRGTQVYTSPISDCGGSFHNIDYSSPLSEMQLWKTMEGIPAPDLSIGDMAEKHQCRRDEFTLIGDDYNTTTSEFNVGDSDSRFKNPMRSTDGILEALFDDLGTDEEAIIDNYYYDGFSSLLLEFPSETNHDHIPNELQCEILPDMCHEFPQAAHTGEANDNMAPVHVDGQTSVLSEIQLSLPIYSEHPEMRDGVIYCMLNTEDTEIPDNDDIFLLNRVSSSNSTKLQKGYHDPPNPSFPSSNVFVENKINNKIVPGPMNKQGKNLGQANGSSARGLGVSFKVNATNEITPATNGNVEEAELGSLDLLVEEVEANLATFDQDDSSFEDDNVPCFSDIEAMILDMDLGPDEKDAHLKKVSKYRNDNMKRKIIRLEQSDHACLQREIESHEAFALLRGRHSKHYIRKTEVLLGRATEDTSVDIDLGRERCGNRISRRQALITMDDAGSFSIKNLGMSSIFVNDKEITSKESRILNSGCLVEIREIPLIFETNERFVKEYMDSISTCEIK